MIEKKKPPIVLFNASVILAGLHTPAGGSGKLLDWVRKRRIAGVLSELILDEVVRNAEKIGKTKSTAAKLVQSIFRQIFPSPPQELIDEYKAIVIDYGDSHVLAAARSTNASFLVTLDKKHILSLKGKFKEAYIVTPKELIEYFSSSPH